MRSGTSIVVILLLSSIISPYALKDLQTNPTVPPGFSVDDFFSGLNDPTSMAWGPDGNLYVSQVGGQIVELILGPNGLPLSEKLVAEVPPTLLGLVFVEQDLFVSYTGSIARLTIPNGSLVSTKIIISDLPHGRHQNDEMVYGSDGFLYVGIGSTGDRTNGNDPRSATVARFKPDGSSFQIFAKGLRNAYGLAFDKDGNLFATDNGPDNPEGPDELNHIVGGGDYGFPAYFGRPPNGTGTIGPVVNLQTHSSSDGLAFYYGNKFPAEYLANAFIAQWGASTGDPNIGKRVVRVPLMRSNHGFVGEEIVFATGFEHPIDVIEDQQGGLLVADYGTGTIYRISYGQAPPVSSSSLRSGIDTSSSHTYEPTTVERFPLEALLLGVAISFGVVLVLVRRRRMKQA